MKNSYNIPSVRLFQNINNPAINIPSIPLFASLLDRLHNKILDYIPSTSKSFGEIDSTFLVVIADDDSDDRVLFTEAIAEICPKIKVQALDNGITLMQSLNDESGNLPDVIFLDINMPGKSGKECLKEIKNNKKFNQVLVVIYSTSGTENDISDTYASGANLYIRKPNTFSGIINVIKKVLTLDIDTFKITPSKKSFLITPDFNLF